MVGSSLAPKLPIMVPFNRMDHQKFNFSLISGTISVGGCWGQPMLLFWKLVDKTQMSLPPEHATRDMKLKISNCLSVRANLLYTFQCETPCSVCLCICWISPIGRNWFSSSKYFIYHICRQWSAVFKLWTFALEVFHL